MATGGPARAPTPRLKSAAATAKTTSESATAVNTSLRPAGSPATPSAGAASTTASQGESAADAVPAAMGAAANAAKAAAGAAPAPAARRGPRSGATAADPLSEKATALLIRRVLCPQHVTGSGDKAGAGKGRSSSPLPIDELLPPLTSRNDVDLELYAFIAIIIRDFVQTWYSKITPDEAFVAETVQIIAHCTRALEQRLRDVDLESLVLDELPDLLGRHVAARRAALTAAVSLPDEVDPREVYHSLCPLPYLSPVPKPDAPGSATEQADNEAAYRQLLVQAVLVTLLPTEDLENECLTALVGQIFSELVIGNVIASRLSEPWLLWEGFTILARSIQRKTSSRHRPLKITKAEGPEGSSGAPASKWRVSWLQRAVWAIMQWAMLLATLMRFLVTTGVSWRALPRRCPTVTGLMKQDVRSRSESKPLDELTHLQPGSDKVPVVTFRLWAVLSSLIELDVRMPWLYGALSMAQWMVLTGPGRVAAVDGILDRVLSSSIQRELLDPSRLAPHLRTLRGLLFPNNTLGKPTLVAPASDAELRALRRRCAAAVYALLPPTVGRAYFGGGSLWTGRSSSSQRSSPPTAAAAAVAAAADPTRPRSAPQAAGPGPTEARGRHQASRPGQRQEQLTSSGGPAAVSVASAARRPGGSEAADTTAQTDRRAAADGEEDAQEIDGQEDGGEARILAEIETSLLDVFSDAYCNKHLMYSMLELVLVRLLPELADKGVTELWEERLH